MLPERDYFKIVDEAIHKKKGHKSIEDFFIKRDSFFAREFYVNKFYSTDLERRLLILTDLFALEISMRVDLSNVSEDTGTWEKDYYAVVRNEEQDGYKPSKSISDDTIKDWFSKNIIEFI